MIRISNCCVNTTTPLPLRQRRRKLLTADTTIQRLENLAIMIQYERTGTLDNNNNNKKLKNLTNERWQRMQVRKAKTTKDTVEKVKEESHERTTAQV